MPDVTATECTHVHVFAGLNTGDDDEDPESRETLLIQSKPGTGWTVPTITVHITGNAKKDGELIEQVIGTSVIDHLRSVEDEFDGECEGIPCKENGVRCRCKICRVKIRGAVSLRRSYYDRGWFCHNAIRSLAERTAAYCQKEISDEEWRKKPGLAADFYNALREARLI